MSEQDEPRSSPSRVAGIVAREITLDGKTYTLSQPDRVRKASDEEALVIGRRIASALPAVVAACAGLGEQEAMAWRRQFTSAMICGIASPEEWGNYFRSPWVDAFNLWHAIDPRHRLDESGKRERTLLDGCRWCYELIDKATAEEIAEMRLGIQMVSQKEALGN